MFYFHCDCRVYRFDPADRTGTSSCTCISHDIYCGAVITLKQTTQAQNVLLKKRNGLWVACLADFGIGRIESITTLPTVQVRNMHDVDMCIDNCMSVFIGHPVQHVARAVQGRLHNIQVRVNAHPHACAPACLLTRVSAHKPVQASLPRCVQESMHACRRPYARAHPRMHAHTHASGLTVFRSVTCYGSSIPGKRLGAALKATSLARRCGHVSTHARMSPALHIRTSMLRY